VERGTDQRQVAVPARIIRASKVEETACLAF